jgi:hypothetical protein
MPTDGPSVVLPVFEAYQAARLEMVQALAEMALPPALRPGADAKVPSAIEATEFKGLLAALEAYAPTLARTVGPLCSDMVPGVQLSALVALARLSRASDQLSATVAASNSLLPHALQLLSNPLAPKDVRLGATGLLLQLMRSEATAQQAIEAGALAQLADNFEVRAVVMKTSPRL